MSDTIKNFEKFITSEEEISLDLVEGFIDKHQGLVKGRYEPLKRMYLGDHDILHQDSKELNKPDNRLVVNFAKYIVDTLNGYFLGIPLKISHDDERMDARIGELDDFNNVDDEQFELSRAMSIYGLAYELIFQDEDSQTNIVNLTPLDTFLIYDDSIRSRVMAGVHYYKDEEGGLQGSYSTPDRIIYFKEGKAGLVEVDEELNVYGEVPIIEYKENEDRMAAFEVVYTLINQINKAMSEKANDVDYFADAYMKIIGAELDEDTIAKIKDLRVINLFSNVGSETNPEVDFISKPDADQTQEHLLDRLEEKIYQLSMVPNLSDENFGASSGVALAYKLQGLDNICKNKERKFQAGLNSRYKVICSLPTAPDREGRKGISYRFSRNVPKNVVEEANVVNTLNGLVSKETALSYLSLVDDPKEELDRMEEEDSFGEDGQQDQADDWNLEDMNRALEEGSLGESERVPERKRV